MGIDLRTLSREARLPLLLAEPGLHEDRARLYNRLLWSIPDDGPMPTSTCHVPTCKMHEHTDEERRRYMNHMERHGQAKHAGGGGGKKSEPSDKKGEAPHLTWRFSAACQASACSCCGYFWGPGHKEKANQHATWTAEAEMERLARGSQ